MYDGIKNYLEELGNYEPISNEELIDYFKRIEAGDIDAKNEFIKRNLFLVVSIAKKYSWLGLELDDFIQEGSIGLMKSVEKYDYRLGTNFSSYAYWNIRSAIINLIENGARIVKYSTDLELKMSKYVKAKNMFEEVNGRCPRDIEMANILGIDENSARMLHKYSLMPISLSEMSGEDVRQNLLEDETDYYEEVDNSELNEILKNCINLANLKDDELKILVLRFGFNGNKPMIIDDIAKIYGVSRQYIEQRIDKILSKIRGNKIIMDLAEYRESPDYAMKKVKEFKLKKYRR